MTEYEYVAFRARENGMRVDDLRGRCRAEWIVWLRRAIARELRAEPWNLSLPKIGKALNRHHTSVMNLLKGKRR